MTVFSLRWKFFAFFIGLGLSISLVMYIPYSRYIKATYQEKLTHVLQMVDIDHHSVRPRGTCQAGNRRFGRILGTCLFNG